MIIMPKPEGDEIDFKIACQLKENSRISYKEIGKNISLSPSSVYTRIKKMEEKGIIRQYSTDIDWGKFGYAIHAFILLKDDKVIGDTPDFLKDRDEVFNCWMVSGEHDYMLEVYVSNNKKLEELMNYIYEKLGRTLTYLIIKDLFDKKISDSNDAA